MLTACLLHSLAFEQSVQRGELLFHRIECVGLTVESCHLSIASCRLTLDLLYKAFDLLRLEAKELALPGEKSGLPGVLPLDCVDSDCLLLELFLHFLKIPVCRLLHARLEQKVATSASASIGLASCPPPPCVDGLAGGGT